ncbi:MAG TPA: helix-turn-helix transcriptional regulator [Actinomycetes bacterium]|nr:helix-turn-helix transcriptional regulator [Actinomycetes bacterium]
MPTVLRIDPELGRKLEAARKRRGWSLATVATMIGPVGNPPKGLRDTQIGRLEAGERNLTAEEAWRLADLYSEIDAWKLLEEARAVSPLSSPAFKDAVREEARRRRSGEAMGFRRYDMVLAAAADATSDLHDHTKVGLWDRAGQRPTRSGHRKLRRMAEETQALPIPA